jgi:hypothetical protein
MSLCSIISVSKRLLSNTCDKGASMTVLREGNLEFTFSGTWTVRKYDDNGCYYRTQMETCVQPTKAVDFLCLDSSSLLLMFEAKDYSRGVPSREKLKDVPKVVAIKVRDSIAGIVGGFHCASDSGERAFFARCFAALKTSPRVVYFFEDLPTPARRPRGRAENQRDVLYKMIKRHLRWLTKNVAVVGLNDYPSHISGLTIRRVGAT